MKLADDSCVAVSQHFTKDLLKKSTFQEALSTEKISSNFIQKIALFKLPAKTYLFFN